MSDSTSEQIGAADGASGVGSPVSPVRADRADRADSAVSANSADSAIEGDFPPARFPSDAELMDGPNALEDNDEDFDASSPASARVEIIVPETPEDFRAGFACLVGRPNAGKSTLTNALVGTKVAITSGRPQTTRHNVRGVVHRSDSQLVLVDTPGLHRPRTLLGKRLNDLVRETLAGVDVIAFCIPADEKIGPGDRFITRDLAEARTPVVAVVTKADIVSKEALAAQLLAVDQLGEWADIVPVSARRGQQIDVLTDVLVSHLPFSPPLYSTG